MKFLKNKFQGLFKTTVFIQISGLLLAFTMIIINQIK